MIKNGASISGAMDGLSSFMNDGPWCSEFHQITE